MRKALCSAIRVLALVAAVWPAPAAAATVPSGFTEALVASGLTNPTAMAFAPDGRLFVCQQDGQLRVIKNGVLLSTPFVSVTVNAAGERGLLGVAFDPNFATNRFVYVYYTATTPAIHNRVSRFTANGDVAVAGSEVVILELDNLSGATNHNGGAMHFGDDGKLYIGVGENATTSNAQSFDNLLGKILRINPNGSIPGDNPFLQQASGKNRAIWVLGLRNPFTFAFQPQTGRMFINDVGQNAWEEINDGLAGSNYGWPGTEGPTNNPNYRGPLYSYGHSTSQTAPYGCAITGGAFYNPSAAQFPAEYVGSYFFADFCSGWIKRFNPATGAVANFAAGISAPVDLHVGPDSSLYYLARGTGSIVRITYTGSQAPTITVHPVSRTVSVGQSATFTVAASGTAPLTYQWQRNGGNISGATSASYTIASAGTGDNGATFRCIVSNAGGNAISNGAVLTVTTNAAPVPTMTQPAAGSLYSAGDTIVYAATGTDAEDGTLPASAFTWQVDFHHDTHSHPVLPATSGATGGSFTIPRTGETSTNVWYRITLTVRDSRGLTATIQRDVRPRIVSLTLATQASGLQVTVDGQPFTAPVTFTSVVGMNRTIGTPPSQPSGDIVFVLRSWSDGGAATHQITTPDKANTYTARFARTKLSVRRSSGSYSATGTTGQTAETGP